LEFIAVLRFTPDEYGDADTLSTLLLQKVRGYLVTFQGLICSPRLDATCAFEGAARKIMGLSGSSM